MATGVAFDRLVIEFTDQVPGYDVRYVPDVRSPGEGPAVAPPPAAGRAGAGRG